MYGRSNQSDPSQPEWRLPASAHRPAGGQTERPLPPPPPPPPVTSPYSPASYGPISNNAVNANVSPMPGPNADPRTWGVRYNQHQIYTPPPVPPRPSSTNEHPFTYAQPQPQLQAPTIDTAGSPPPQSHGHEAFADAPPHSASSVPPPYVLPAVTAASPPPPPKIPEASHNVLAQQGNEPARPPLLAQGAGPAATQGSYGSRTSANTGRTGSSALGHGTPSDWEYLGPTPGDFDDAPWFPEREPAPPHQDCIHTPPGFSTGLSNPPVTSAASGPLPPGPLPPGPLPPGPLPPAATNQLFSSIPLQPQHSHNNHSISPVSPMTAVTDQGSRIPSRMDSVSSYNSSFRRHAESIDNVIDAWVRPLPPQSVATHTEHEGSGPQPSFGPQSNLNTPVAVSNNAQSSPLPVHDTPKIASPPAPTTQNQRGTPVFQTPDPYEDLDPWFKSSLTRFIAMLRKEAVADSDEERFKIFTAFMSKETKLREILYNIEHEPQDTQSGPRASILAANPPSSSSGERKPEMDSGSIPVESEGSLSPAAASGNGKSADDTVGEYSSGGRPSVAKRARQEPQWQPKLPTLPQGEDSVGSLPKTSTRHSSVDETSQKQVLEPLTTNPPRPIYTPFQYTEGPQRGSDNLTFARPAYQAYSDLRQASAVSGRVMSNTPQTANQAGPPTSASSPPHGHKDGSFLGRIRDKSSAYQVLNDGNRTPVSSLPGALRQGRSSNMAEELRAMVWTPLDKQTESSWHITAREELEKLPDDFSYIQETIDRWESSARARREQLEQERTARQEESESQIDDMFNEKEIGYADINTLEEEFRQSEARVQLDEERQEVDSFMKQVFNPLDERLKDEISTLRKSYDSVLKQLDRDQKGQSSPVERCSPSVTMTLANEIHTKLEVRFQKRLDIALDCERRRKKAERRPLVFMGDMASLRKLDADFDRMEKRNILEAAKDRDGRANQLIDSFDDAILHGLGINQSLLDELGTKVSRLDPRVLRSSGLPDSEVEQILKSAATFAASLRVDSESILRCSGLADETLNEADYNVSVAEAAYGDSEPEVFQRLEEEKKKEDKILQKELSSKLQDIQKSPKEIEDAIQRLLQDLRETPAADFGVDTMDDSSPMVESAQVPPLIIRPATGSPSQAHVLLNAAHDPDEGHKERLRRALEDAKKRNAARVDQ